MAPAVLAAPLGGTTPRGSLGWTGLPLLFVPPFFVLQRRAPVVFSPPMLRRRAPPTYLMIIRCKLSCTCYLDGKEKQVRIQKAREHLEHMGIKHDTKKSKRHSTQIQETPISHKLTYLGHARAMSDASMFFDRREVPRRGHGTVVIGARRERERGREGEEAAGFERNLLRPSGGEGGGRRAGEGPGGGALLLLVPEDADSNHSGCQGTEGKGNGTERKGREGKGRRTGLTCLTTPLRPSPSPSPRNLRETALSVLPLDPGTASCCTTLRLRSRAVLTMAAAEHAPVRVEAKGRHLD